MVLVEGTLTSFIWTDRNGENHIQHSIIADSIAFVNAGKAFDNGQNADAADTPATKARKAEGEAPVPPADAPQDTSEDLPF